MRPLTIANGFAVVPDKPFRTRHSVPLGLLGFEAARADSEGAHSRLEFGKNGSHPSLLLVGTVKTDCGTALLEIAVLEAGPARAARGEKFTASVAMVRQK